MSEGFLARARAQAPSLGRAEQAVARVILERPQEVIELTSAQLAELAGASRPTVVRTCQSLGLAGYQQLRVLLAQECAALAAPPRRPEASGPLGVVTAHFHHIAAAVDDMTALLDDDVLERAVQTLAVARRLVVVGHGVSAALAADVSSRLRTLGRMTERSEDVIEERILLAGLDPRDAALVVSGSGTNTLSLAAARIAHTAGAPVVAVTAFSHSPLVECADTSLVTGMANPTFLDEVVQTSRIPQAILLEALVALVGEQLGEDALLAKQRALDLVADFVEE